VRILAHYSYLLAAVVVLVHTLMRNDPFTRGALPIDMTVIASSALLLLGKALTVLARRYEQRRRDRRAAALVARLLDMPDSAPVPPYVVYLRPFATTGRLTIANPKPRWLPLLPSFFAHETTLEFETVLSEALQPDLSLVALGRPGEHVGAGRIAVTDDDWKQVFQRLVKKARWIVMIPSHEGETGWEVRQLVAQEYLGKTVFLMPPTLRPGSVDIAAHWSEARARLAHDGVHLPPYTGAGQLFRLGWQGRWDRSRYMPRLTSEELRSSFAGVTG
jgi:hypothetical protein